MEARFSEAELIEVERYYDHRYWDSGTGPRHTFFRLIDYVRKTAVEPIKPFTPTATVPPVRPLPKRKKTTTWNGITRRKK